MFYNNGTAERFFKKAKYKEFYKMKKEAKEKLTWQELRKLAKEKEIPNYTKMNRKEIEEALNGIK